MTIAADSVTATLLDGAGVELGSVAGTVALDESWAPHVRAQLTIPMPADEATLELLDPREPRRVLVQATASYPLSFLEPRARSFDLGLRGRVIDHDAGEVRLTLASDEALLMDDVRLAAAADTSALAHQASLRAIVNSLLSRIGAALEPGTADAPFRVLETTRNILVNSGYRASAAGWLFTNAGGVTGAPARAALSAGDKAATEAGIPYKITVNGLSAAASGVGFYNQGGETGTPATVTISAGQVLRGRCWIKSNVAATFRLNYEFANSSGAIIGSAPGTSVAVPANVWTLITSSATAPANAARLAVYCYTTTATAAGTNLEFCGGVVTANGVTPDGFFDGDTTDTSEYGYNWTGTVNASQAERLALIDRSPQLLHWEPGVSAWDFLQPLFQAAGLRLFCNEAREWHLVDGSTFVAPGMLQLTMPGNLHSATDTTERDGEAWFDAAVVRYSWRDPDGTQQERIDYYGEAGYSKVITLELERAYPGPGFAQYLVKRAAGWGRTVDLEALSDLTVRPSQALRVTAPATPTLLGVVRNVTFDLGRGTMRVASRGLTDVPAGAYALADPDMSYSEAPAGVTYAAWTNPNGA